MVRRVSKVDLCMFCGAVPCKCNEKEKPAPKPRTPRKTAAAPITESNTGSIRSSEGPPGSKKEKADATAAMRAASKVRHQGATIKEDHDAQDETAAILDDPEFVAAIQAFGPLMHPLEQKRFERVLEVKVDHKTRANAWKKRVT